MKRRTIRLGQYLSLDGAGLRPLPVIRYKAEVLDLMGQWSLAEDFLLKEIKNSTLRSIALWLKSDLAQVFIHQGQPDKALSLLDGCEEDGSCDQELQCRLLGLLGMAHRQKGDLERSLEYHRNQLLIAQKLGDGRLLSRARGAIGNILADREEWRPALECFLWRLENDRKRGDLQGSASPWGMSV